MQIKPIPLASRTAAGPLVLLAALVLSACGSEPTKPTPTPPAADPVTSLSLITGSDQTASAGAVLADTLVVQARTEAGKPAANVRVAATATGGTMSPEATQTGTDGTARFVWTLPTEPGSYEARFTLPEAPKVAAASARATATPAPLALHRVKNLVPGEAATLIGTSLLELTSLTLDGHPVVLSEKTDSTATFRVPLLRACETDGRAVALVANDSVRGRAPLSVPGALRLEVGESRLLSRAELMRCLALPAEDHDYALTALNLTPWDGEYPHVPPAPLFTLRSWTESDAAPALASQGRVAAAPKPRFSVAESVAAGEADDPSSSNPKYQYSDNPTLFDPKYATAGIGDELTFVDWPAMPGTWDPTKHATWCDGIAPHDVPTYKATVVAVAGRAVIAVDQRSPNYTTLTSADQKAYLQRAARIADRVMMPTMRHIFAPDYEPNPAAGGRYIHLLTPGGGAGASHDGGTGFPQSFCQYSSEVVTTISGDAPIRSHLMARNLASILVHEYAHNADGIVSRRLGAHQRHIRGSRGFLTEAFASLAEETAVRIALDQSTRAVYRSTDDDVDVPYTTRTDAWLWGRMAITSTYRIAGQYDLAASILLYAQEQLGEAAIGHRSTTAPLYQRMASLQRQIDPVMGQPRPWTIDELAGVVGVPADTLLDRWALAAATADLIDYAIAEAKQLPHFQSYDHSWQLTVNNPRRTDSYGTAPRALPRTQNTRFAFASGSGNYAVAYIFANEERHGSGEARGISLTFEDLTSTTPMLVRITRLR